MAQIRRNSGKKGTTYTVRIRIMGKEVTKTFNKKTEANDWAKEMETDIKNGKSPTKNSRNKRVRDLFHEFLRIIKREKPQRHDKIKEHLEWWLSHIGETKLYEVQPADIFKAREKLLEEKIRSGEFRKTSTANRYTSSLRQAFEYGVTRLGWLQFNVVKQIRQLTEPDPPERFLDRENELPKLAEECANSKNKRLLPLFMLAVSLGLRKSSLVGLHMREVNLDKKTIRIPRSRMKRKNMITLSVPTEIMPYLIWAYENRHPKTGLLFPGTKDPSKPMIFDTAWKNALHRAGINDFRFHDTRHTAGTYHTEAGLTLSEVAALLGHKTLAMASRYSHITEAHKAKAAPKMAQTHLAETAETSLCHLKPITPRN